MVEKLFLTVLSMSGTASAVILVVLLARLALRKAPKAFSYALWAVVLFRLLCPFSIESAFSAVPKVQVKSRDQNNTDLVTVDVSRREVTITVGDAPVSRPEPPAVDRPAAPGAPELTQPDAPAVAPAAPTAAPSAAPEPWFIAGVVWLAGAGFLMGYSLLSLLKLRRRLVGSVPLAGEKNVRLADHIPSPFVLGLIRPQIYLPSDLPVCERDYILLHERTHIRRFDHVTRALAWLALAIHWFNPLVWLSFYLAGKDMEMSCDEVVLRKMGREIRADYSSSLLRLSVGGKLPAGPLAFGGGNLQSRVKNVLRYKKPALWVIAVALIAVVCAGAALATSPGGARKPFDAGLDGIDADLNFTISQNEEGGFVRIEGRIDGIELDHTVWFPPSWYERYDSVTFSQGRLMFDMPLCGGEAGCSLDAFWTYGSRTAVTVTATPMATYSSYFPTGNLVFTVDLSKGTLLELDGYIPKMHANAPELVPTEEEAVRTARIVARLLEAAEKFYESSLALEPTVTPPSEPSSDLARLPWETPEAENAPSYKNYFAQVIDYHYPDDTDPDRDLSAWRFQFGYYFDNSYTLIYEDPDLYFSRYYFEYVHGRRPDLWLWKIAEIPALDIFYADERWIYAVADGRELIRMDYFGEIETLFTDELGLIRINGLYDGKVLYFWAGLPEGGAAICRLYIPEGRADALYRITQKELESYYYEPPASYGEENPYSTSPGYQLYGVQAISNFEFVWATPNPEFWELYDSIVLHAENYPQYFSWGLDDSEIKYYVGVDYGVWEYTDHYYNALTGEHLEHPSRSGSGLLPLWWKEMQQTPLENTRVYEYVYDGPETGGAAAMEAARTLAALFMDDLTVYSNMRTFRITEYRDLSVTLRPTLEMSEASILDYRLRDDEIGADRWIARIDVEYRYEGIISPAGPGVGQWLDFLWQGSPVDFLLCRDGNTFTLQSRYRK